MAVTLPGTAPVTVPVTVPVPPAFLISIFVHFQRIAGFLRTFDSLRKVDSQTFAMYFYAQLQPCSPCVQPRQALWEPPTTPHSLQYSSSM